MLTITRAGERLEQFLAIGVEPVDALDERGLFGLDRVECRPGSRAALFRRLIVGEVGEGVAVFVDRGLLAAA